MGVPIAITMLPALAVYCQWTRITRPEVPGTHRASLQMLQSPGSPAHHVAGDLRCSPIRSTAQHNLSAPDLRICLIPSR